MKIRSFENEIYNVVYTIEPKEELLIKFKGSGDDITEHTFILGKVSINELKQILK